MKLIFAVFLVSVLLISVSAEAKSFYFQDIFIDLDLSPDGSIVVTQERTYQFSGSFSFAYLDVLKKGSKNVEFLEIRDLDEDRKLEYVLDEDSNHVRATWYYSARNQPKKFLIKYKIEGGVKKYQDVADFFWKVIEDEHERIDRLEAEIELPSSSPELFKVFVHSSANPGELEFSDDLKKAYVRMSNIPRNGFIEFRVLTQPNLYHIKTIQEDKYESILAEERSNFYFYGFIRSPILLIILIILPILLFFYFYLKFGREPKDGYEREYEQQPPHDIPPMALSNLLEGEEEKTGIKLEAKGILATIFDLARRGYLDVREGKTKKLFGLMKKGEQIFVFKSKSKDKLESFEKAVLTFLKSCSTDNDKVSTTEIIKYCKKNPIETKNRIDDIDNLSRKWFEEKYFPISARSNKKNIFRALFIVYSIFLMFYIFSTLLGSFFELVYVALAFGFIFGVLVGFPLSKPISKRTPESAMEVKRWKAFKKYITDFSAMKDAPVSLLHVWDKYLVYAIVLGVADKLLENIGKLSIEKKTLIGAGWYYGTDIHSGKINLDSLPIFINNLSSTINSLSSSTSVGGGFSGGGGGGGGGGSSGAG